ncbi:uncharacterized protein C8Q71DRAFT_320666 [Rhodofomes roseus]|uniref:DRBM domain-containing protein n=1 Tax=Rhodofomes roseus TaxID=34475 RepID=A0ABQ8K396_9APHY|nr:uncharacterized protein C8Q71DRAFT_320666 [Rhodofomes roseus]KAH9830746.1 hypothetical protein C8Q71DRAFT_320666 [Rhodofomes roseus]
MRRFLPRPLILFFSPTTSFHTSPTVRFNFRTTSLTPGLYTMSESDHWRMRLNNYLQSNGGTRSLTWEVYQSGPLHQPVWTAIAYVKGVEYGRSTGSSQNGVKEEAARQTVSALYHDRGMRA